MFIQLIQQYHNKVERLIRYGTRKETTVRKPFMDLLEQYARSRNLELVPEVAYHTRSGRTVYPRGNSGYWIGTKKAPSQTLIPGPSPAPGEGRLFPRPFGERVRGVVPRRGRGDIP